MLTPCKTHTHTQAQGSEPEESLASSLQHGVNFTKGGDCAGEAAGLTPGFAALSPAWGNGMHAPSAPRTATLGNGPVSLD